MMGWAMAEWDRWPSYKIHALVDLTIVLNGASILRGGV